MSTLHNIYKIKRTFHPVGHGGFYTERFSDNNFVIVYDCGAKNVKHLVSNIDREFQENNQIDILFISHFHQDHISGLEHILKTYTVKCIVLPLLDDEEKIRTFLFNVKNETTLFLQNLCLDPEKTIKEKSKKDIRVVFVSSEIRENKLSINDLPATIFSGDHLVLDEPIYTFDWHFIPFNFEYKKRNIELKKIFFSMGIPLDNGKFQEFYKKDEQNQKTVRSAYDQVLKNSKDLNTHSLTLYSGLLSRNNTNGYCKRGYLAEKFYTRHDKPGCLYLGDYNAKESCTWDALEVAYSNYFQYLSVIQIPHHGSIDNYNEKLNRQNNIISIISAPFKQNNHHPSAEILKAIILNNGIPIVVTEDEQSKFIQNISLYV